MTSLRLSSAASSLLSGSSGLTNSYTITAHAVSTFEQYCLPRYGGPITTDSIWPSATIMYNGTTLATVPFTLVMGSATANVASVLIVDSINSTNEPIASTAYSSILSRTSNLTFSTSGTRGQTASPGATPAEEASLRSSFTTSTSRNSMATGPSPTGSSPPAVLSATLISSNGRSAFTNLDSGSVNRSASSIDRDVGESNTRALSSISASGGFGGRATMSGSEASIVTASGGALTQTAGDANASPTERAQTTAPPSSSLTENLPSVPSFGREDGTVDLSPLAVDALQLAQYVKHLGVSLFNASSSNITWPSGGRMDSSMLQELVANISLVSFPLYTLLARHPLSCISNAARENSAGRCTELAFSRTW
jgi:hypothetical protein